MNWVVPRWALVVLIGIALSSVAVGLVVEQTTWAAEHPFTLDLLSSLAGFGASLAFASVILNRIARRGIVPACHCERGVEKAKE